MYLLDCAFSVGVVGTLVVFVWRGVWILFDLYLYPENAEYSAVGSLVSVILNYKLNQARIASIRLTRVHLCNSCKKRILLTTSRILQDLSAMEMNVFPVGSGKFCQHYLISTARGMIRCDLVSSCVSSNIEAIRRC